MRMAETCKDQDSLMGSKTDLIHLTIRVDHFVSLNFKVIQMRLWCVSNLHDMWDH